MRECRLPVGCGVGLPSTCRVCRAVAKLSPQKMRSLLTSAFKEQQAINDMMVVNRLIVSGRMELEETLMLWKGASHVMNWFETAQEKEVDKAKAKSSSAFLDDFFRGA